MMVVRVALAASLWVLVGCGGGWTPLDSAAIRGEAGRLELSDGWRVVEDSTVVRYLAGDGPEAQVEVRSRRVLHFVAPKIHSWVERCAYDATTTESVSLRARLLHPNGKEKTFDDAAASDRPYSGGAYVLDSRERALTIGGIRPGSILEVETVERRRESGRFGESFAFGTRVPVGHAQIEVHLPPGFVLDWTSEPEGFEPTVVREGGATLMRWSRAGLRALKTESHGPDVGRLAQRIRYRLRQWPGGTAIDSAVDVSRWSAELNEPRAAPTPAVRARVDALLAGPTRSPAERVRVLSEWVRRKVRYVAIELGIGGWQAQPAEFTADRLYGDCKAKAVLLKAMLAAADVKSRLALIKSGREREVYDPIRGVANFNHMVLLVDLPEGTQLVDPTAPYVPFGDVPFEDQDKDVLPVSLEGAQPIHQPAAPAADSGTVTRLTLTLDEAGRSAGRFEYRGRGHVAARLREALGPRTPDARVRGAAEWLPLGALTLDSVTSELLEANEERLPVNLAGELHRREAFVLRGETAALRVADVLDPCFPTPTSGKRRTAARFGPARRDEVELRLQLPAGWQASADAEPFRKETSAGTYGLMLRNEGGALVIQRSCELAVTGLSADAYDAFGRLARAALAAEGRPIVLRRVAR